MGKSVEIDDIVICGGGEKRFGRLGRDGKFRFEIVLDDVAVVLFCPAQIFVALAGACRDPAGKAAVGRGVQDIRTRSFECGAVDPVAGER